MSIKGILPVSLAVTALLVAGCANSVTVSTLKGIYMTPKAEISTVADVVVIGKKVMGQAKGPYRDKVRLEREAILRAFGETYKQDASGADVLVGSNFFYEFTGSSWTSFLTVTVIGYPARYKNFRPEPEDKSVFLIESSGDKLIIGHPADNNAVQPNDLSE